MKEKREPHSLKDTLEQALDIPSDLLHGGCLAEVRGRGNARVCGCRRIVVYTPALVELEMADCRVRLRGTRLICRTFAKGEVTVDGHIDSLEYGDIPRDASGNA